MTKLSAKPGIKNISIINTIQAVPFYFNPFYQSRYAPVFPFKGHSIRIYLHILKGWADLRNIKMYKVSFGSITMYRSEKLWQENATDIEHLSYLVMVLDVL
jgi:hypothetical protein